MYDDECTNLHYLIGKQMYLFLIGAVKGHIELLNAVWSEKEILGFDFIHFHLFLKFQINVLAQASESNTYFVFITSCT